LKYQVLTPTNKAARVVSKDAQTIHRFLAEGFRDMKALKKQIRGLSYIILDEVSMIRETFYKIFLTIKKMSNIQFIVAGDFRQLGPVNDRADFNYKESLALLELCDNRQLQLTVCRRSDDKLFKASLMVDDLDISKFGKEECDTSICWTNKKRIEVNDRWMKWYSKEAKETITLPKLGYDVNSQVVTVYEGLPIIARINAKQLGIYNNETFTVTKLKKEKIIVSDGGEEKEIDLRNSNVSFILLIV
jgi:ATP-dependent exoDNAse (exonuclease V) alpha subunit